VFRLQKSSSATLLFKQVWKQNLIRHWMVSKVQNSKWLSSGCFQPVLCRFPCFILCMIVDICATYTDVMWYLFDCFNSCFNSTQNRNNCNERFVLRVFFICFLKLVFIWVFFVCIASHFNIINIVSYIEIISVFKLQSICSD
jgi:hypothetical protein